MIISSPSNKPATRVTLFFKPSKKSHSSCLLMTQEQDCAISILTINRECGTVTYQSFTNNVDNDIEYFDGNLA